MSTSEASYVRSTRPLSTDMAWERSTFCKYSFTRVDHELRLTITEAGTGRLRHLETTALGRFHTKVARCTMQITDGKWQVKSGTVISDQGSTSPRVSGWQQDGMIG
ncbi:hypothetical protein E2C01_028675 [Portunus trituberculatus]|uniref:Uncharacterized protein n=1 Tax=Portunus trituberculatus TaxID=210409 RepID=A0A5B7EPQ6_PORTR|nr:hypothetical protein [Portunus trituberculatus]